MNSVKDELQKFVYRHGAKTVPDLGGETDDAAASSLQPDFVALAESLERKATPMPESPNTRPLQVVLWIILVVAIVFLISIGLLRGSDAIVPILVGQGTIFSMLTGVALLIADRHFKGQSDYARAENHYQREQAIIRLIKCLVHSKMTGDDIVAVVGACADLLTGSRSRGARDDAG